jgi:hypothetical protein
VVVCADKDCEFRVRAQWKKAVECVEITIVNGGHTTCLGNGQPKRKPVNYQQFLREAVPAAMHIDKSSKPKDVMSAVQHHFGEASGYLAVYRTLKSLNNGDIETERKQFRQLPMYMEAMKKLDPDGLYSLSLNAETKEFQRLFICPSSSVSRYKHALKMVALDGTFTTSKFRQTLLFAATLDANHEIILLAWALVESENEDSWRYFCRHLTTYVFARRSFLKDRTNPFLEQYDPRPCDHLVYVDIRSR